MPIRTLNPQRTLASLGANYFGCLVLLVGACTPLDDPGHPVEPQVRDSAGVQIVENTRPLLESARTWTITGTPVFEIGGLDDPTHSLYRVQGAIWLPGGNVVVANAGSQEVLVYDAAGALIRRMGGVGEGPGEFSGLDWVGSVGPDSLAAFDWRLARVSVLDTVGRVARIFPLRAPPELGTLRVMAAWNQQRFLLVRQGQTFTAGRARTGVYEDSLLALKFDLHGTLLDTLGLFPTTQRFISASEQSLTVIPLPFGRSPALATDQNGFWFGSGDQWELEWRGLNGGLLRLVRLELPRQAVHAAHISAARERILDGASDASRPVLRRLLEQDIPWPDRMPAFDALLVGGAGELWVREFSPEGDMTTRWFVLERSGRLKAVAQVPRNLKLLQVLENQVLALRRDEYEVEYVGAYPITKVQ